MLGQLDLWIFSGIASQLVDDCEALLDELVFVGTVRARIFELFFDGPSRSLVDLAILGPHMGGGGSDLHREASSQASVPYYFYSTGMVT